MSDIDDLTYAVATRKYVERNSKKIVDSIFTMSPFFSALAQSVAEGTLGYDPDEDEFMDWVAKERGVEREHPPESIAGGQIRGNIEIRGNIIYSGRITVSAPRYHHQLYGITTSPEQAPKQGAEFSVSPQGISPQGAEDEEL